MNLAFGIPLYRRDGTIRAFTMIDAWDWLRFRECPWWMDNTTTKYVAGFVDGEEIFLHRAVLGLESGDPRRVDHINGDGLDNRRANLRVATTAQNAQNQGSRGGSSKYRGVTWDKSRGKWMASAMLNGRRVTIGRFDSEDEAGAAAAAWRAEHMPYSREAVA